MIKHSYLTPIYFDIEDWKILEEKTFHYYSEEETPFDAVLVEIGIFDVFKPSAFGNTLERHPILRWITKTEYEALKRNSGVIIF